MLSPRRWARLALTLASAACALPPWSSLGEAVAIQSYDPVAHFTRSEAARGGGDAWTIHGGRLYLNYDKAVSDQFRREVAGNIAKAEGWWPAIKSRIERR
jgi:hypothetical protein